MYEINNKGGLLLKLRLDFYCNCKLKYWLKFGQVRSVVIPHFRSLVVPLVLWKGLDVSFCHFNGWSCSGLQFFCLRCCSFLSSLVFLSSFPSLLHNEVHLWLSLTPWIITIWEITGIDFSMSMAKIRPCLVPISVGKGTKYTTIPTNQTNMEQTRASSLAARSSIPVSCS